MSYKAEDILETADEQSLQQIAKARELTRRYNQTDYFDTETKIRLLRELFGAIGDNVAIDTPFHCDHGDNIFIGSNVVININCTFVDNRPIRIGSNVLIASNVQIYTGSHPILPRERFQKDWKEKGTTWFRSYAQPVTIEDGAWIGGGAILLPGVTIGANSVIGAGSVVTHSVPANCVAVGNPCRIIREFQA